MFKLDDKFTETDLSLAVAEAEKNYLIRKNDFLQIDVFTNDGERIIDPNFELSIGTGAGAQNQLRQKEFQYLVRKDGKVKLPIIGDVMLESQTINDAETQLEKLYDQYYKESFVKLRFVNKRIIVLGANGGQVIPLTDENTSLFEVIALSGGIGANAKAQNIKVIRGDYKNPEVFRVDLSKVSTMTASMLQIRPGDVVYIEPWKRPVQQSLRDVAPVLSVISSVLTLMIVIQNI